MQNDTPVPATSNPQDSASFPGASNGADFQSTAPREALTDEASQELTVQQTGEPIAGGGAGSGGGTVSDWAPWIGGLVIVAVIVAIVVRKLINEPLDEFADQPSSLAKTSRTGAQAKPKKTAPKKKKSNPPYRRKKNSSRKR